jgi:class 3 adenylate cyclase
MASRRARIQDFYGTPRNQRAQILEKAAASWDQFSFAGAKVVDAVVVRTDLNGYSEWSRERSIEERVSLLDDFFSAVVPELRTSGGVFFRDEGDCLVSLFTKYFGEVPSFDSIEVFCMKAGSRLYGQAQLSAKTVVARGNVAIFQKAHEVGSQDWSAEGDAFVRAVRLEQAVPSAQEITFFADEYQAAFAATSNTPVAGGRAAWIENHESLQVPGLALTGGWSDVVVLRYRGLNDGVTARHAL